MEGDRRALVAVEEVDRHEIAAAEAALAKDVGGDVRGYAQILLDDHDSMVNGHQEALARLDDELIPAASDPDVARHLETTRTAPARAAGRPVRCNAHCTVPWQMPK